MAEHIDREKGTYRNGSITVEQTPDGAFLVQRMPKRPRKGSANGTMGLGTEPETVYETMVFDDAVEHARSLVA